MRELSSIELSLVSGGYGECEGDDEECDIIVIGHPPYYPPSPPYYPPTPPYSPPPYYPPETGGGGAPPANGVDSFHLKDADCQAELSQFDSAFATLTAASPTFRALIANLQADGYEWDLHLVNNGVDETFFAGPNVTTPTINWDPFSAIYVHNAQGQVVGSQTAMMGLAHEIIHAAYWNDYAGTALETAIMATENAIIAEVNAYVNPANRETPRLNHLDGEQYFAQSATSTGEASARPSCS